MYYIILFIINAAVQRERKIRGVKQNVYSEGENERIVSIIFIEIIILDRITNIVLLINVL